MTAAATLSAFTLSHLHERRTKPNKLISRAPYPPMTDAQWTAAVNEECNLVAAMESEDSLTVSFFPGHVGTIQSRWRDYPSTYQYLKMHIASC